MTWHAAGDLLKFIIQQFLHCQNQPHLHLQT